MKSLFQGLIAAAIGGAVSSAATVMVDAGDLKHSLTKMGLIAASGAGLAVVHLFIPSPKA
jgi:hypothetical protein